MVKGFISRLTFYTYYKHSKLIHNRRIIMVYFSSAPEMHYFKELLQRNKYRRYLAC